VMEKICAIKAIIIVRITRAYLAQRVHQFRSADTLEITTCNCQIEYMRKNGILDPIVCQEPKI
jgi:hypothetical protein